MPLYSHLGDNIITFYFLPNRFIKQGHDVNQRHPLGWTPLHVAAVNGSEKLVFFSALSLCLVLWEVIAT